MYTQAYLSLCLRKICWCLRKNAKVKDQVLACMYNHKFRVDVMQTYSKTEKLYFVASEASRRKRAPHSLADACYVRTAHAVPTTPL